MVRVPSGSAAVDQNGGLVVFPGSILHLECLHLRRHGDPEWTWTSEAETYLTGKILMYKTLCKTIFKLVGIKLKFF